MRSLTVSSVTAGTLVDVASLLKTDPPSTKRKAICTAALRRENREPGESVHAGSDYQKIMIAPLGFTRNRELLVTASRNRLAHWREIARTDSKSRSPEAGEI